MECKKIQHSTTQLGLQYFMVQIQVKESTDGEIWLDESASRCEFNLI